MMLRSLIGSLTMFANAANAYLPDVERSSTEANEFACALYAKLAAGDDNLLISPVSIRTVLAMTAAGARAETALEMAKALRAESAIKNGSVDFTHLHHQQSILPAKLTPREASQAERANLAAMRTELNELNEALEQARTYDASYHARAQRSEELAAQINALQKQLNPYEFRTANALWLDRAFQAESEFLDIINRHYGAGSAQRVDFSSPEQASSAINRWTSEQTKARIPALIAPNQLDANTRLVLTNAVYFLGQWQTPFQAGQTRAQPFFQNDGSEHSVPMMRSKNFEGTRYAAFDNQGQLFETPFEMEAGEANTAKFYPKNGWHLLELPYQGDRLSMWILSPIAADAATNDRGLKRIEASLNARNLERWSEATRLRDVVIDLPKFKLDSDLELSKPLTALGMRRAFVSPADPEQGAQFDGISHGPEPADRVYIGAVVHKAFIEVSEQGTEAAAATAVVAVAGAARPVMVPFIPQFRADRPFLFLIRDNPSGNVLFIGRLMRL
jgi:serine protease inhibitor